MKLTFVDNDADVAVVLRMTFREFPEIDVFHGDMFALARNSIVSPANSQGFMDGGLDSAITKFFGLEIEAKVRDAIARRPEGRVPVGSAIVIKTSHTEIPFLLVVPTMEAPEAVEAVNAYRAMSALLKIGSAYEEIGRAIFCPGLCAGVGGWLRQTPHNRWLVPTETGKSAALIYIRKAKSTLINLHDDFLSAEAPIFRKLLRF